VDGASRVIVLGRKQKAWKTSDGPYGMEANPPTNLLSTFTGRYRVFNFSSRSMAFWPFS
jgi:hypothetical protein